MKLYLVCAAAMMLAGAGCGGSVGETTEDVGQAVVHSNGLGDSWTDTSPLGTFSAAQAMAACNAVPLQTSCVDWPTPMCNGGADSWVLTYGPEPINGDLWGWAYAGPDAGVVVHETGKCLTTSATSSCATAIVGGDFCLTPGTVLQADQVQPAMTIVGQWR